MKYEELKQELAHKERTVKDLISYIRTRTSEVTPNYSLLLGAGASYTSGIRTGYELVEEWRKEAYEKLSGKKYETAEGAKEYLIREGGGWYSQSNEYSSLFEYKFDLPPQRRRFVEREVDNKLPSIGYSYLVSLTNITSRYFDTIYTTNFDDLLNEAFYQFSQVRPVVCAHDSSVNSVSMNSNRPKIIKLHGDYLFDDIKSTLRETETLESNIKNKLIEFSKDYGLIVIGYSGNDRSIMDVISHLLKTEEHLKNGIYWCLREDDYINPELRKLLWKERAYFVRIDGFDEVMAEIHHGLEGELSLKDNFTNTKKDAIALTFTEDKFSLCDASPLIGRDIEKLKRHKENLDISNLIREINQREISENGENNFSEVDFKNLLSVDSLIKNKKHGQAKELVTSYLNACESERTKAIYLRRLININELMGLEDEAISVCDQLISLDEYNVENMIFKASFYRNMTKRCEFIKESLTNFEYSYSYHNFVVRNGLNEYRYSKESSVFSLDSMLAIIEKSLKLEPSASNPGWLLKLDLLKEKFRDGNDKKAKKEKESLVKGVIDKIKDINPVHINYYKARLHSVCSNEEYKDVLSIISEMEELYLISKSSKKAKLFDMICDQFSNMFELKNNQNYFKDWGNFLSGKIASERKSGAESVAFLMCSSSYAISVERDVAGSLSYMKKAMPLESSYEYAETIVNRLCEFSNEDDAAVCYVERVAEKLNQRVIHSLYSTIYNKKEEYAKAIQYTDKCYEYGDSLTSYVINKSYLLLKEKKYEKVISFIELNADHILNPSDKDHVKINLETAKKLSKRQIDEVGIRNIISHGFSKNLVLSAHCLLELDVQARRILKDQIEKNYTNFYIFKDWPVVPDEYMSDYLSDLKKEDQASCAESIENISA